MHRRGVRISTTSCRSLKLTRNSAALHALTSIPLDVTSRGVLRSQPDTESSSPRRTSSNPLDVHNLESLLSGSRRSAETHTSGAVIGCRSLQLLPTASTTSAFLFHHPSQLPHCSGTSNDVVSSLNNHIFRQSFHFSSWSSLTSTEFLALFKPDPFLP